MAGLHIATVMAIHDRRDPTLACLLVCPAVALRHPKCLRPRRRRQHRRGQDRRESAIPTGGCSIASCAGAAICGMASSRRWRAITTITSG